MGILRYDVYIRNEREYPTNRIMVANLFARGYFKGFDCSSLIVRIVRKNPDISREIKEIFVNIKRS